MLELVPLAITLAALAGYGTGLHRLRRRCVRWRVTRVAAVLAGSLCAAAAVLPPIASRDELFPVHVALHLLLGMAAPAFLALSALSPWRCARCRGVRGGYCRGCCTASPSRSWLPRLPPWCSISAESMLST